MDNRELLMKLLFLVTSLSTLLTVVGCGRVAEDGIDTRMDDQTIQRQEEMERVDGTDYRKIPEGEEVDVEQEFEDEVEIDD